MFGMYCKPRWPMSKFDVHSGAYCSMVLISLLALPLELPSSAPSKIHGLHSFLDGLPEYLSRCALHSALNMAQWLNLGTRPDVRGRHLRSTTKRGSRRICVLCTGMPVYPWPSSPNDSKVSRSPVGPATTNAKVSRYLDVSILVSWLSARQYAPEGGFAGRTNKLVDGCYSHWVGGCWPLLEAAVRNPQSNAGLIKTFNTGSFFSREGLIRYILCCCQAENGGLRDKPLT